MEPEGLLPFIMRHYQWLELYSVERLDDNEFEMM
jgi:hypothetical protein